MVAKHKRQAMNGSVATVSEKFGCALPADGVLTRHQLRAFSRRATQPVRLTMQQREGRMLLAGS